MSGSREVKESEQPRSLRLALISDTGGPLASGTSFYYNFGNIDSSNSFIPTNSFGPGPQAVSKLVQGWKPDHLIAVGDLAYNVGASTLVDASLGQYYNNLIHPYPSPAYKKAPYLAIDGRAISAGQKAWPYNIYDFPKGFPNPNNPRLRGGSPDKVNRFWASLGNHDYGLEVGYGQIGVTPYDLYGEPTGVPVGPSSTTSLQASVDYYLPFLSEPELLGDDSNRLNIGSVDKTGNSGVYYSVKLGGTPVQPLVEVFQLDSERLNVNAGYEDWNSAEQGGMKREVEGGDPPYVNQVSADENLFYDPADPGSLPLEGTTTDPGNGYAQYEWLRRSLAESNATWKIIASHHPAYASGRWKDNQPDSHMSNPWVQRLLKALPPGSIDAFYNGENHFYERILETSQGGIGLGIPFFVNGNGGRNLERKMQIPYGGQVYYPPVGGYAQSSNNPNQKALDAGALLPSNPVIAGTSGLAGTNDVNGANYANGLYGYGFGAVKVDANDDFMLFHYREAAVPDPAIANHLSNGIAPEVGFKGTRVDDWIPQSAPGRGFSVTDDVARFKLSITGGVVTGVTLIGQGQGYMRSKGGNSIVRGFNVYGNNVDLAKPWLGTAQVDLTFSDGKLADVRLTDGGRGYELAVQSALENNQATTTDGITNPDRELVVGIDYNLEEIQYGIRDDSRYNDWYMIAATQPFVKFQGRPGSPGRVKVKMLAKGQRARDLLSGGLQPTTGYSGLGAQDFGPAAQGGRFQLYDHQALIVSGELVNGVWRGEIDRLPRPDADLRYSFEGDPITSYNVNFKPSQGKVIPSFGRLKGQADAAQQRSRLMSGDLVAALSGDVPHPFTASAVLNGLVLPSVESDRYGGNHSLAGSL